MGDNSGNLVNGRCYLVPVVDTINQLKKMMTRRHWDILRRTPFSHLMDIEPIVQERSVLDALMQMFDERSNTFHLGDSFLQFKAEDVSLILGLQCDGTAIDFKRKKERSVFEEEYFSKGVDRNRDCLVRSLMNMVVKRESKKEESFVKLLLVYILGFILFPTTSCLSPAWLPYYMDNLSKIGQYAWAQATHKWMMDDVPLAAARVKERCARKQSRIGYVRGCKMALINWFYEVTGNGKKIHFGRTPRILCYGVGSYKKQAAVSALID
ncbi:protein MAINTENANCE OF MERISTEMS-like [Dioscorea cayenensis subsp. rotundata]|uniref:Protein MAINTENANCE OF MERISTEMS-like n=1 Tax=Dioscorea cayennensis subsp. rotundata TaxID=55577 RepID=A0AB40CM18_DIOCR|nr:protein MAINTENANCE OF MERISTEMS-like [Dioscorea cayenensis subsp. rotundata]